MELIDQQEVRDDVAEPAKTQSTGVMGNFEILTFHHLLNMPILYFVPIGDKWIELKLSYLTF